jgi:disulfide oxidoreductase YuzD
MSGEGCFSSFDAIATRMSNSHVESNRAKIIQNEKLSPLFLFRDERNGELVIDDGYHRLCSVYTFDEDAVICRIAGMD